MPAPATPLLVDALDWLAHHGITVTIDTDGTRWIYAIAGQAVTEGDLIARAVALGMMRVGRVQ